MSKKQTKKTSKAATKNVETVQTPVVAVEPVPATPKSKRARKGTADLPDGAPAPDTTKATEPVDTPTDDSEEICVFAIRLLRSERDLIHQVSGSGKATRFVKTVALAAARGDVDTIHTIVAEIVNAKRS